MQTLQAKLYNLLATLYLYICFVIAHKILNRFHMALDIYIKMPYCLKKKISDTVILSMTFVAETRTLRNRLENKLAVAQKSIERTFRNITR